MFSRLLIMFSVILFVLAFIRSRHVYRKQAAIIVLSVLAPFVTNGIYIVGLSPISPGLDLVPFGLLISCLLCAWAILRFGLADIIIIANSAIMEDMKELMIVMDLDNRIVKLNSVAWDLIGRDPSEVLGQPLQLVLPDLNEQLDISQSDNLTNKEIAIRNDATRYYDARLYPLFDRPGIPAGKMIVMHDITERKRIEEELRTSEEKHRSIFENMIDIYGEVALDGTILEISPSIKEIGGYTREELLGKSILDYHVNPGGRSEVIEELLQKGRVHDWEFPLKHKNGEIKTFSFNVELVTDDEGVPVKTAGIMRDITERKRIDDELKRHRERLEELVADRTEKLTETVERLQQEIAERKRADEELRLSEERYRRILEASRNNIIVMDNNVNILYANRSWIEDTGYTLEDFKTIPFSEVTHPDDLEKVSKWALRVLDGESIRNVEFRRLTKDGEVRWVEASASRINWPGAETAIVNVSMDITERRRAEEELRLSEERYRRILDASRNNIVVMDETAYLLYANRSWQEDTGYTVEDFNNRSFSNMTHPEDVEKVSKWFLRVLMGEVVRNVEYRRINKNGEVRWMESSASLVNWPGTEAAVVNVAIDITERKQGDEALKDSREQLRNLSMHLQTLREDERTRIAQEVHDDLGQALTVLKMDIAWMTKHLPVDQKPLLEKAQGMSELMDATIRSVKRISADLRPGLLDDLGLAAAIEWQADEFKKHTEIECKVEIIPQEIQANREVSTAVFRIFQEALTNIIRHAHATTVEAELTMGDGQLVLTVEDNGKGITESDISKAGAFGLVGIRERAHALGGQLEINGEQGKGTKITVIIPVYE